MLCLQWALMLTDEDARMILVIDALGYPGHYVQSRAL